MNNCPYSLDVFCPGCKGEPECKIIESHHIIPRGHMPGKLTENWELNIIPMYKSCHDNYLHIGHWRLWKDKHFTMKELILLVLLGRLPYYPKAYPLLGERAQWALRELREWPDVPTWIERAFEK